MKRARFARARSRPLHLKCCLQLVHARRAARLYRFGLSVVCAYQERQKDRHAHACARVHAERLRPCRCVGFPFQAIPLSRSSRVRRAGTHPGIMKDSAWVWIVDEGLSFKTNKLLFSRVGAREARRRRSRLLDAGRFPRLHFLPDRN